MLYLDGDHLSLTHYCDAGNRPRMVGKDAPDGKTVEFEFVDISGGNVHGHMHHVVFTLIDANHHTEDWTFMMPGDKPVTRTSTCTGRTEASGIFRSSTTPPEHLMDREWNDSQPIYRQLRDRVVAMILDGVLEEGDPLPSVRNVAAEYRVNPLTVLKGYQQLVDEELVENRRGPACSSIAGARALLLQGEREKFLDEEWPRIRATIQRLGLTAEELLEAATRAGIDVTDRDEGEALKPWPASKPADCARRSAPPSPSTASISTSRRAASSG